MSWFTQSFKEAEAGWKQAWDDSEDKGILFQLGEAPIGMATGFFSGLFGGKPYTEGSRSTSRSSGTDRLLKTHVAGQANNFGRYGDISQQAPGGWIRQQQKNRYGRASTILTRGTSRKTLLNKKKS